MTSIRVFEAAARLGKFTDAATELGMTQAAVSYQIKVLEDRVGAALFVRQPRGVEPTPVGRRFARRATEALDILGDAFADARGEARDRLHVSVAPTFAVNVLAPTLGHFQIAHPDVAVRVDVSQGLVDFERDDVDVAIRTGTGGWPGLCCHRLTGGTVTPMLAPDLAASIGGVTRPRDLLGLPLIDGGGPLWRRWFAAAGLANEEIAAEARPHLGPEVMEAAAVLAGQGVGLLDPTLHQDAIGAGRLLRPFEIACPHDHAAWLVYPATAPIKRQVALFRDWLLDAVSTEEEGEPSPRTRPAIAPGSVLPR